MTVVPPNRIVKLDFVARDSQEIDDFYEGHSASKDVASNQMLSLAGKGALVIGTKRVGQLVTRRLAKEAANLAIAYRSSRAEADRLYQAIAPEVERACLIQGDVTVEDDVRRMVEVAGERLGDLSFVVNLASEFPRTPFHSLDGDAWDRSLTTAKGSYLLTVNAAHQMMGNAGPTRGHIVLFSDWAASHTPYRDYLPYLTAKAAIDFMTRGFAVELASHGILVNAIAPGPTMRPVRSARRFGSKTSSTGRLSKGSLQPRRSQN